MPQSRRKGHQWQPITDLPVAVRGRRFPELDDLLVVFGKRRSELEGKNATREFLARMVRSWSIETGILERLYTLSENATLTLVEHGFDAALLSHGDTDLAPEQLVDILRDHQDAAEGLFDFVRGGRALSTSYVKELHQVFTRHQASCDAMDPNGDWVKVPLRRGDWKLLPNNPGEVKTGEVWHHYCPPEQVASEMDALVALHAQHGDVHYVVEAAWLHHRFTQIHPFQDGNGRVARALASLVCIRGRGLPVVVLRTQKESYIRALEHADRGDLAPLIEMFEKQQREAVLKASGVSQSVMSETSSVDAILRAAKGRLDSADRTMAGLTAIVDDLAGAAATRFKEVATRVEAALAPKITAQVGAPGRQVLAFASDARALALQLGYAPVFSGAGKEVSLHLQSTAGSAVLVVDFHQVAPAEDGLCSALTFLIGVDPHGGAPRRMVPDEPFTFTVDRDPIELRDTFSAWLERAITRGLDLWQRDL